MTGAMAFPVRAAGESPAQMQPMGTMMDWLPIETKPPLTHVEERGEYRTDDGMLWYFKPTHWRPLSRRKALDALTEHDQALGLYEQHGDD
jgi:hypothetical protein